MQICKKPNPRVYYTGLAVLITFIILLVTCLIKGVPVKNTLLYSDSNLQYVQFTTELWDILHNKGSIFYSWHNGLGSNWLPTFAYYTSSPTLLSLLLVPRDKVALLMTFLIWIKLSFASGTMTFYLHRKHNSISALIFGLLYGLSGFCLGFYWNIMWLDIVMLFPLLVISIEKLVTQGIKRWYILFLAVMVWSNFYMGFILCLFVPIFFVVELYGNRIPLRLAKHRICAFILSSLLAVGISGILLVPSALALKETVASQSPFGGISIYTRATQVVNSMLFPSQVTVLDGPPNLYTGMLITLLCLFGLAIKKKDRKSVCYMILMGIMLLACYFSPLDFLIHGLKYPNCLPSRFSYMLAFVSIVLAREMYLTPVSKWCRKWMGLMVGVLILYSFASEYIISTVLNLPRMTNNTIFCIDIFAVLVYAVLLFYKDNSKKIRVGLLGLVCIELVCSVYTHFPHKLQKQFKEYATDYTRGAYRVNSQSNYRPNQGSIDGTKSISNFSSFAPYNVLRGLWGLGYTSGTSMVQTRNPIPIGDDLLGVRFYFDLENCSTQQAIINRVFRNAENIVGDSQESVANGVYVNRNTLSLGYVASNRLRDWKTNNYNTFSVYNDLSSKLVNEQVYRNIQVLKPKKGINVKLSGKPIDTTGLYSLTVPNPTKINREPFIEYECKVPQTGNIAILVRGRGSTLYVNTGEKVYKSYVSDGGYCYISDLEPNTKLQIRLSLGKTSVEMGNPKYIRKGTVRVQVAGLDKSVYQEIIEKLSQSQLEHILMSEIQLDGDINVREDGILMTSIPDNGWWVYVDGVRKKPVTVMNGMIGVPITTGKHIVHLEYHTPGLMLGLIISLSSISLLGILYASEKLDPKKKEKKGTERIDAKNKHKR